MLVNFRPYAKGEGVQCNCAKLQKMHNNKLPMANGHVAVVGDWYCGPCKHVLTQNCDNVPKPDERLDARRLQKQMDEAIEKAPKQLRKHFVICPRMIERLN